MSNSSFRLPIKWFFLIISFTNFLSPAYAIPPPETLVLVGGSVVYPFLLVIGTLTVFLKYIGMKTKLYVLWRVYLPRVFASLLIMALLLICFSIIDTTLFKNVGIQPVTIQTVAEWQSSGKRPLIIDLRGKGEFDSAHLLGAVNFPEGEDLSNFLKNYPSNRIILYCELGVKSGGLGWLRGDTQSLNQVLKENRLFYIPGGLQGLIKLGGKSPIPIIINLPPVYANYLLKQPHFQEIAVSKGNLPSLSQVLSDHFTKSQSTPIISSQISGDLLAKEVSQLKINPIYVTHFATNTGSQSITDLIEIISVVFFLFYTLRRKELFRSLLSDSSRIFPYVRLFISLLTSLLCVQLAADKISIPFDLYLYSISPDLPMNVGPLIGVYAFFGLSVLAHLVFSGKKRLELLKFQLINKFTLAKYIPLSTPYPWGKLLIASACIGGVYLIKLSLPTLCVVGLLLAFHLLIDGLLYNIHIRRLSNSPRDALKVVAKCGFVCDPTSEGYIELDTRHDSIGIISATAEQQSICFGLFSGKIVEDKTALTTEFDKNYLIKYCQIARDLLLIFQQDIKLNMNQYGHIISIHLDGNYLSPRALSRDVLLKHYHLVPSENSDKRFTSEPFEEVFENPTPLMIDVLKMRWGKGGGCLKALRKLAFLIKYNDKCPEQFFVLANKVYLDKAFEKAIFSASKLHLFIRNKLVPIMSRLALENVTQDYYTLILPRTQLRLTKLTNNLQQPLSAKQLKRIINNALATLCKESAMWQCYSSLLHQQAFNQLPNEAHLVDYTEQITPLAQSYTLLSQSLVAGFEKKFDENTQYRDTFLAAETLRTHMRELQLKEWQLIGFYLEKLRIELMLPISLAYLTRNELNNFPSNEDKLRQLLAYRYEQWQLQNQLLFPATFSLTDLEQPFLEQEKPVDIGQFNAIRVAGNQQKATGNAVLYAQGIKLDQLARDSILIAENLMPEQLLACQHIRGVVLRKGSYLSHTSIIGREKNIPIVAQFPIASIKENDKLLISGDKVTILCTQVLDWDFLDRLGECFTIGNKAQRLALMSQKGFNIPQSILLKHATIQSICKENSKTQHEDLTQLFNLFGSSPLIVRSSTNLEDSSHYSYAGLFYSQANIHTVEELISAIEISWQRLEESANVIRQYSKDIAELSLNLIIQPYIQGQYGGILFTESSIPGQMQVEISANGVEGITQGDGLLTSLHINEYGQPTNSTGGQSILTNKQYQTLYRLGREIEALFGYPQDIEWVLANQQFYIIQSRDITFKLNAQPIYEMG